jgi:N-acetyl-1-D-myo-inositol-2-amino-2-deoxy-alpha-D-glucopyranoside deacetylase
VTSPVPVEPFGDARRVLFVHAHPDDESISTGGLIAHLTASGCRCFVLTATRGERGEVRPGVLDAGGDLVALRLVEWADACARLGVAGRALLGTPPARAAGHAPRRYQDSGMAWLDAAETLAGPAPDAPADALSLADTDEVAVDIAAYAEARRVDALLTYDAGGGYGHPDHVLLHGATRAAASRLGLPFFELSDAAGAVVVDASAHLDAAASALGSYASQLRVEGDELVHVGGQRQQIAVRVGVRRV